MAVLQLPPEATWREAKAAHRRLRKELHPDSQKAGDTGTGFIALNQAFEALLRAKQAGTFR